MVRHQSWFVAVAAAAGLAAGAVWGGAAGGTRGDSADDLADGWVGRVVLAVRDAGDLDVRRVVSGSGR